MPRIGLCQMVAIHRYVIASFILPKWAKGKRDYLLASIVGVKVVDVVHISVWNRLVSIARASLSMREKKRPSNRSSLPVLLIGSDGNGKTILCRRLAHHLGLKYFEVDCYSLWSDVAGTGEAKLRNAFAQAARMAPCVFVLKHVDTVGKDATTDDYDIRVVTCLKELMGNRSQDSNQPMIIIGTVTKSDHVCVNLAPAFLYRFPVEPLHEKERMLFIEHLLRRYEESTRAAENQENILNIAKRTAGHTVADIERIVETARFYAKERAISQRSGGTEDTCRIVWPDFEKALLAEQSKMSDAIGAPKVPQVKWDDVGGLVKVKETLLESIRMYVDNPALSAIGLRRSGALLYGPPGCGKTLIAKAVATECALNFLSVKGPELLNMYVGQSEQNIREVFDRARFATPCVIFFDELDALAPNRGRAGDSGGVMDRVVSQLLAEMDGLHHRGDIFIIGATNRVDLIDPSLLRPGRFDQAIYVGLGDDFVSRLDVLNAVTRRLVLDKNVNKEEIVRLCPRGMSGADYYALAAEAALLAAQRKVDEISQLREEKRSVELADEGSDTGSDDEGTTDYQVIITRTDFLAALRQMKPSISAGDLLNYSGGLKQL